MPPFLVCCHVLLSCIFVANTGNLTILSHCMICITFLLPRKLVEHAPISAPQTQKLVEHWLLRRYGSRALADAVSRRVRDAITRQKKAWLRRVNTRQDARDAWEEVREVTGSAKQTFDAVEGVTAQVLNDHYATISHDVEYQVSSKKQMASSQSIHIPHHRRGSLSYFRSPETDSNRS